MTLYFVLNKLYTTFPLYWKVIYHAIYYTNTQLHSYGIAILSILFVRFGGSEKSR